MMAGVFPELTCEDILAFQFSSWYPIFKHLTIQSTIIRPLDEAFQRYLLADGVRIPEGSDNLLNESTLSDDGSKSASDHSDSDDDSERFAFPELDALIRQAVTEYGAVFPKLNFSSPKDASWILPPSSPLKCTSPMDVYLLLKSSDFVTHDMSTENLFGGCIPDVFLPPYDLELVLRKWLHVDPSREFRCFVRDSVLLGISQRDMNFYEHLNDRHIRERVSATIKRLWEREIKQKWPTRHYTFDLILTRELDSGHIIDFNPYAQRTDSLLFTYDELRDLSSEHSDPIMRTIDSRTHAAATRNAPTNVHNMVPFELFSLGVGQTVDDFAETWRDEILKASKDDVD